MLYIKKACFDQEIDGTAYDMLPTDEIEKAITHAKKGDFCDAWYYLVDLGGGNYYPFPSIFISQEEREALTVNHNEAIWDGFYKGILTSKEMESQLVTCPTELDVSKIRNLLETYVRDNKDYERFFGGLIPRWAA